MTGNSSGNRGRFSVPSFGNGEPSPVPCLSIALFFILSYAKITINMVDKEKESL